MAFVLFPAPTIRLWHHIIMWFIVIFTIAHVYIGWLFDLTEKNFLMGSIFTGYKVIDEKKVALIGLGNILMGDEGVGVHAVEALRRRYDFSSDLDLIDGGTLGLDLLPLLEGAEKIFFLDALHLQRDPGTIAVLEDAEIPSFWEGPCPSIRLAWPTSFSLRSSLE